nr:reverse transcriptase domain-containing protein [Tanacetum cinerariifolium]
MDLFGPTFVKSLNKKSYCLVVTDDYSRSDNGTELKNNDLNQFSGMKGIKREFSVPRTPQQNSITERKNKTLIKTARTMLIDSLLSIPFWLKQLILLAMSRIGKFNGKVDEGFLVGYYVNSKAFRVFNNRTRIVQETLHVKFLENKHNVTGEESNQQYVLFLVWSFGYTNPQNTDGDDAFDGKEPKFDEKKPESEVIVSPSSSDQSKKHDDKTKKEAKGKSLVEPLTGYRNLSAEFEDFSNNSIDEVNAAGSLVPTVGHFSPDSTNTFSAVGPSNANASPTHRKSSWIDASQYPDDLDMLELEDITYFDDDDNVGAEADFNNLETSISVSPIPTTRVHKDHHVTQIISDLSLATQARSMKRVAKDQGGLSQINNEDFHTYGKLASTPIDTENPLLNDPDNEDVDVHTYRSMIGSLMYLTSSRPDIMFACMSAKRTSWNEFTSSMASAVICLSLGKGIFRVETPLFEGMLVAQQVAKERDVEVHGEEVNIGDVSEGDVSAAHVEVPTVDDKEVSNAVKDVQDAESAQDQGRTTESQAEIYKIDLDHANKVLSMQEDETKPAEVQETEGQARKNMIGYLKNVAGFKMDYFKGMSYDDIHPIFEAMFNSNMAFLQKTKEQIKEEESRALKRINETLAEKAAKRQKLDEEVEELKRHLQIMPNKDDDVYTEATPLARKVFVVDYKIIKLNNKPYYKIIRADDTYQFYVSFLSLLKNFDREDLEALWSLVKERFSTTKPKNFSDDFLLVTLGEMLEKPDIHAGDLEESKKCTWSNKGQGMEAIGIMWCANHKFYNYPANFVSREEVPTYKIHSRLDVECCFKFINSISFSIQSSICLKYNLPLQPRCENDPRKLFTAADLIESSFHHPKQPVFIMKSPISNNGLLNLSVKHEIDQDSLNSAAGGNFLDKMPCDCLSIIESKSKVRYSRDKPVVAKVSTNAFTSGVSPDVVELKDMVRALLLDKKVQNQSPAPVKTVKESCVTYGGAHSYRIYPTTDGNVYRDNIQEYVSQAYAVNYNQGNTGYRPQMMSNQIRPPGFPSVPNNQNVQRNNQNRFIPNQNRGNDFNQGLVYQPLVMKNMQTQGQNMQNQLTNLTDLITKFVNSNTAFTSSSGTLLSNMIANPKSDLKAITTRSGMPYDGLEIPPPVVENEPETTKDIVNPTNNGNTKDVQPQAVQSKPVTSELAIALKLCEMARTSLNEHCSEVFLKKLPEKLGDPGMFLIPCDFPGMAECLALADLGASINLMPYSMWKILCLPDLTPTCMTLELADHSISRLVGVAEDVYVKVGELTLRVGKEVITFNLDRTLRYSANYSDMTAKRIDVIDMALVELKALPLHLEYAFLEGNDKLLFIIAKDLSVEEKTALITVLKSDKRAIAWKLSEKILKRCEDTNLCLSWEKSHFMVKGARPMTRLLEKDTPFIFSQECVDAFHTLKRKLTEAPILIALNWDMPFELMYDASDFAIGAVLGKRQDKHFRPIHYASKTMTDVESNYTTTEKEMFAVVYAFKKFWSYWILNKSIVYTNHSALKYLFEKKYSKARLLRWNPLISSMLATLDQPEVTMDQITQPERFSLANSKAAGLARSPFLKFFPTASSSYHNPTSQTSKSMVIILSILERTYLSRLSLISKLLLRTIKTREFGQAQRLKTSASWEAPHAYL